MKHQGGYSKYIFFYLGFLAIRNGSLEVGNIWNFIRRYIINIKQITWEVTVFLPKEEIRLLSNLCICTQWKWQNSSYILMKLHMWNHCQNIVWYREQLSFDTRRFQTWQGCKSDRWNISNICTSLTHSSQKQIIKNNINK